MNKYDFAVNPWQVVEHNFPKNRDEPEKLRFLLRYAILAPSSHNTQPWKFAVTGNEVRVRLNADRWLRAADPEQRELHFSVGCAIENLLIAAEHFGYAHEVSYFPDIADRRLVAVVRHYSGGQPSTLRKGLFDVITTRHTNHRAYEARPISESDLAQIESCVSGEGLSLYLTGDQALRRSVDELLIRADALQFADPAFREELSYWMRQGVYGAPWLVAKLSQLAASYLDLGGWRAKRESEVLMSAPVFGLLCSSENSRQSQVMVGQALERTYLTANSLGIRLQPLSQLVQVPEIKTEFEKAIPLGGLFPQQPFRLGYAPPEPEQTPRRPLEEALA